MSFLQKVTGKSKFVISILLMLLVTVNRWKGLGLTPEDWNMILAFAGLALGADALEGIVSQFANRGQAAPPGPPKQG